jgi:hypothetical protein
MTKVRAALTGVRSYSKTTPSPLLPIVAGQLG